MKKLVIALIASTAAIGAAQAQDNAPRAYVGVGVASADHRYDIGGATNINNDGYKASGKIFGGYEFDQTWAVEAGYTDFRKSDASFSYNGTPTSATSDGHSFYVAGKATKPLSEQVSVYGKLGAAHNKSTLSTSNVALNRDVSKTELYGGVGVQYNLNKQVALTAEYERYGKQKDFGAKADVVTVGARYSF